MGHRHRSHRHRRRRGPADDHRHEEQPDSRHPQGQRLPDGAAADRRVQEGRALESAGAAAGGRHRRRPDRRRHRHRAVGVLPDPGREDRCDRYEALVARSGRGARPRHDGRRGDRHPRRVPRARPRRQARNARAPGPRAKRRTSSRWFAAGAASRWPIASACRIRPPIASITKRSRKALEEGICVHREHESGRGGPRRIRARARRWRSRSGGRIRARRAPARDRAGRRRHVAERDLRKGTPGTFKLDSKRSSSRLPCAVEGRTEFAGAFTLEPDAERLLHLVRAPTASSSPTTATTIPHYAGNVVKAMASAKHGYPHVVALFRRSRSPRSIRHSSRSASRRGSRWSPGSTTSCSPASRRSSASRRPSSK